MPEALRKAVVDDVDAFSITEFCRRYGFSQQAFYKHKHLMPRTFRVGARVLISRETAAQWRAERERATAEMPPP